MAKLLMVVSSARTIRLADGSDHPTGYLAEEVLEPYEMFEAAGVDVVIASPEGKVPQPDPWGFEPYFHYPKVDEDFMFSVLRRFAYHPDRVRVTFTHFSELNLVAVRRGLPRTAGYRDGACGGAQGSRIGSVPGLARQH